MRIPRKVALLGATAATLALIPASASAYSPAERVAEKKQNDRIKKLATDLSAAKNKIGAFDKSIATQGAALTSLDTRVKTIEAVAPQIVDGLGQLKTGLETAGAGLKALQSLATSTEYAVGQVYIGGGLAPGSFVVTADIPDAAQQAQTMQTFNAQAQTGVITLRVAIRSAESDGTGAALPAAHCRATVTDSLGRVTTSTPNAALGGAPFYPIADKSPQTSTDPAQAGFPFGQINSDSVLDLTQVGTNAVAPAGAASAGANTPFTVQLACVDTSPSASDPTA